MEDEIEVENAVIWAAYDALRAKGLDMFEYARHSEHIHRLIDGQAGDCAECREIWEKAAAEVARRPA